MKGDELAKLKALLPSTYVVLSPYEGLDSPIVLSAWNHQLKLDSADDSRIPQFIEEYWRSQNAPEPTAACTGGLDAPRQAELGRDERDDHGRRRAALAPDRARPRC